MFILQKIIMDAPDLSLEQNDLFFFIPQINGKRSQSLRSPNAQRHGAVRRHNDTRRQALAFKSRLQRADHVGQAADLSQRSGFGRAKKNFLISLAHDGGCLNYFLPKRLPPPLYPVRSRASTARKSRS